MIDFSSGNILAFYIKKVWLALLTTNVGGDRYV
jgi:hypothetical protein